MPRNGSGSYTPPTNSWFPATNGTPATASDWTTTLNDVASALTQSVSRDGQTTMTGNLPMGGNKLTGLANGIASGDSLAWQQLFSQGLQQDVASAATVDLGAVNSTLVNITGTTSITSFGTNYNGPRFIRFAGVLTLTNSATLVLPGNVNITTAAGDSAIAVPLGNPATGWRVFAYQRANGNPFVDSSGNITIAAGGQTTITHSFLYNENGGEIALYNNLGNPGTLVDLSNGSSRFLHVLSTGDAQFGVASGNTNGNVIFYGAGLTEAMRITPNGNVLAQSTTGAIGYGASARGTVTQTTSKSTAVTLNRPTGTITMNSAALAAGAMATFSLNNSLVEATDKIIINASQQTASEFYRVSAASGSVIGQVRISVTNLDTVSRTDAIQLDFAIIK